MISLNTESLNLFDVPFKHLNCAQRLDLYRALQFDDEKIDELEYELEGLQSELDKGDYW